MAHKLITSLQVVDGSQGAGKVLTSDANGLATWATPSAGTPGGASGHVQFNNAGAFGGEVELFWDFTNNRLGIGFPITPTLTYRLEVNGDINIASGQVYRVNGTQIAVANLGNGSDVVLRTSYDAKGDIFVATGDNAFARLPVGTNGHVLTADSAEATGVKWAAAGGGNGPTWTKYTISIADAPFNTAALTDFATLFTPAANEVIHGVRIKHSTAFSGGGATLVNVSVGVSGNVTKYASAFDVFQAVANGTKQLSSNLNEEDGATAIILTATSDVNLSTLTAGSVDIWVLKSTVT